MAPVRSEPADLCTLQEAQGLQCPGRKVGWWVGPRRRWPPSPAATPSPTLPTGQETWDPMGPYSSLRVCELRWLLLCYGPLPPCHTMQEVARPPRFSSAPSTRRPAPFPGQDVIPKLG